jgi:hypothetical protein
LPISARPDGEHLPLAAGERAGELGAALLQAREQHEDLVQGLGAVLVAEAHLAIGAEQEVVLDRHRREQRARLGHERHAEHDALLERKQGDRCAVVLDLAASLQHAHQRVEQGRLAGAVRADDGDHLARPGGDRQAVQDFGAAVAGVEVSDVEQELGHGAQCSVPR